MRVLITGGAGFIGAHLAQAYLREGCRVDLLDNLSRGRRDATLAALLDEFRRLDGQAAFVHCASGNRVGAAIIPHLMLDHDYAEDAAITAAMGIGLRSPELLEWALDFTRRRAPARE